MSPLTDATERDRRRQRAVMFKRTHSPDWRRARPPFTWPIPTIDFRVVALLRAMIDFESVRAAARRCGPELFADESTRAVAAYILSGTVTPLNSLDGRARTTALLLIAETDSATGFADSPEFGLHLLRLQTDIRFRPLLAAQFDWAADAVREGWPIPRVLEAINNAAEVTLGVRPFDPADASGTLAS